MPKLSPPQILDTVLEYCEESGIEPPENLREDFMEHLGGLPEVAGYTSLRQRFCSPLQGVLKFDDELQERYMMFYKRVADPVRLRLAILLGLNEDVQAPRETNPDGLSDRETLCNFMIKQQKDKPWTADDLRAWRAGQEEWDDELGAPPEGVGQRLYSRIHQMAGWNKEVIATILGEVTDALLYVRPLEVNPTIEDIYDARLVMCEYLDGLWTKAPLLGSAFKKWTSKEGVSARSTYEFICDMEGGWCEKNVREVLGSQADHYLAAHPFEKRKPPKRTRTPKRAPKRSPKPKPRPAEKQELRGLNQVEKYLREFLASLPREAPVTQELMLSWSSGDGSIDGTQLVDWIESHMRGWTPSTFTVILNESFDRTLG